MKELQGVVIGAGDRGSHAYTPYLLAHPEQGRIVAVAEPDARRRESFGRRYGVPESGRFADHRDLFAQPRIADFALIATPDSDHVEPALLALRQGYDVLLEKPMAVREEDCHELVRVSEEQGALLQICHVLRYAPLYQEIKRIIDSGELGDLITIQHSENVSYWHYAHSYCRGNWRSSEQSSPMILAKSCHDLDLLCWFSDSEPIRLASTGQPNRLHSENKPEGAPLQCIEGCPHAPDCPYDAVAFYRDLRPLMEDLGRSEWPPGMGRAYSLGGRLRARLARSPTGWLARWMRWRGWPVSVMTEDNSLAGVEQALRTSRYGRCVYQVGDNDQVSSQSVSLSFAKGINASFTMHSTSDREGRETRIDGTRGSLRAGFYHAERFIEVSDHKTGRTRKLRPGASGPVAHGEGDGRLFEAFLEAVRRGGEPITTARESLWSHRMAFAADRSRREGVVVEFSRENRSSESIQSANRDSP